VLKAERGEQGREIKLGRHTGLPLRI